MTGFHSTFHFSGAWWYYMVTRRLHEEPSQYLMHVVKKHNFSTDKGHPTWMGVGSM